MIKATGQSAGQFTTLDKQGVGTITNSLSGQWGITWANAFASANYNVEVTMGDVGTTTSCPGYDIYVADMTASGCSIIVKDRTTGTGHQWNNLRISIRATGPQA